MMKLRTAIRLFALGAGFASGAASAATFVVNSSADAVDATPGDGVCLAADPAVCTLRAAVMEANATAGADIIDLTAMNDPLDPITLTLVGVDETFELTSEGQADCEAVIAADASVGDLDITQDVEIVGAGPGLTVIRWAEQGLVLPAVGDRIFHIQANVGETVNLVSIRDLMVTGGSVGIPNDLSPENPYNCGAPTGEVGSQQVYQFRRFGGGIAIGSGAAVALFEEAVHGGGGGGGGGGSGGGRPPGVGPGGEEGEGGVLAVELERVAVIANQAGSDAGGIDVTVETSIVDSVLSANVSYANGGALYLDAQASVAGSLIGDSSSDVPYETGAISADLLGPNVGENGGGIFATGSGVSAIDRSAINLNEAIGGGAIASRSGVTLNLTNTTVSGNVASDVGGGITTNGVVNLRNVTVANNRSASDSPGGGAGLNSFGGNFTYENTILSNNLVQSDEAVAGREANCGCTGGSPTCAPGIMVSDGFNLNDEAVDTCALTAPGDLTATDPLLEALANNGGLTETHRLPSAATGDAATSPAIDAADNNRCPNNDQRGSLRPEDGDLDGSFVCDIGAFELFIARADLNIANVTAPDQVDKGTTFDVVVEIRNDDANGVVPAVTYDASLTPIAGMSIVSAVSSVGSCTIPSSDVVNCAIGDMDIDAQATVTLTLTSDTQGAYALASVVASGDPDVVDPVPGNNAVTSNIAVIGLSDIELTGSVDSDSVRVGSDFTFDYVVSNNGEDDAANVRFVVVLPSGVSFVSASSSAGDVCSAAAGEVGCQIGDLAVGATATIEVVAEAVTAGDFTVAADVAADQNDPDVTNNSVDTAIEVLRSSSGGGGGGCAYNPGNSVDPTLPALLAIALLALFRRRRVAR